MENPGTLDSALGSHEGGAQIRELSLFRESWMNLVGGEEVKSSSRSWPRIEQGNNTNYFLFSKERTPIMGPSQTQQVASP